MDKQTIIKIIRQIFLQICMISFGILFINAILIAVTHNYGGEGKIDYLFPLGTVICSILCGISIVIFYIQKLPFIAKCVIHFIIVVLIVTGISILFGWLNEPLDYVIVYSVLLVIYIVIWVITYRNNRTFANKLNEALKDIKDED